MPQRLLLFLLLLSEAFADSALNVSSSHGNATSNESTSTATPTVLPTAVGELVSTRTETPTSPVTSPPVIAKIPFKAPVIVAEAVVPKSWCYHFFPTWLLVIMYFVTCVVTGISACGLVYNMVYLDTPRTYNKHGEVMVNKLLGKQRALIIACGVCFLLSILMVVMAFISMMDETFCGHVVVFIVYFLVILVVLIIIVANNGKSWLTYRVRKVAERMELQRRINQEYEHLTSHNSALHQSRPRTEVFW